MDPSTRTRLELLLGWYDSVRRSTLRLLDSMSPEELAWQPDPHRNPAQWIFAHIAAAEDLAIHRRLRRGGLLDQAFLQAYRSGVSLEASRGCRLAGDELRALLARLKRRTGRALQRLLDGTDQAAFPDLLSQLEKLIVHEIQHQGQVHYIRKLREGGPSGAATATPRLAPARASEPTRRVAFTAVRKRGVLP